MFFFKKLYFNALLINYRQRIKYSNKNEYYGETKLHIQTLQFLLLLGATLLMFALNLLIYIGLGVLLVLLLAPISLYQETLKDIGDWATLILGAFGMIVTYLTNQIFKKNEMDKEANIIILKYIINIKSKRYNHMINEDDISVLLLQANYNIIFILSDIRKKVDKLNKRTDKYLEIENFLLQEIDFLFYILNLKYTGDITSFEGKKKRFCRRETINELIEGKGVEEKKESKNKKLEKKVSQIKNKKPNDKIKKTVK